MALDLGARTIGLAVSDPGRKIALSLGVLRRRGRKEDMRRLAEVVKEHEVSLLVIGLPLHLDGRESEGSRKARAFADLLEAELHLPTVLVDEALSTVEAEKVLLEADLSRKKRKKVIDGLAAAVILQSYLSELAEEAGS